MAPVVAARAGPSRRRPGTGARPAGGGAVAAADRRRARRTRRRRWSPSPSRSRRPDGAGACRRRRTAWVGPASAPGRRCGGRRPSVAARRPSRSPPPAPVVEPDDRARRAGLARRRRPAHVHGHRRGAGRATHEVHLTPAELAVLELLMTNGGKGVTTDAIIEAAQLDETSRGVGRPGRDRRPAAPQDRRPRARPVGPQGAGAPVLLRRRGRRQHGLSGPGPFSSPSPPALQAPPAWRPHADRMASLRAPTDPPTVAVTGAGGRRGIVPLLVAAGDRRRGLRRPRRLRQGPRPDRRADRPLRVPDAAVDEGVADDRRVRARHRPGRLGGVDVRPAARRRAAAALDRPRPPLDGDGGVPARAARRLPLPVVARLARHRRPGRGPRPPRLRLLRRADDEAAGAADQRAARAGRSPSSAAGSSRSSPASG